MANSIKIKRSAVAAKVPLTTDLALGELAINTYDGKLYLKKDNGTESIVTVNAGGGGSGDVVGPGSSTDNAITRFDGGTGLLIQNSTATLDDSGVVSVSGANISGLTVSSAVATDGSKNLVSVANTGTGDNVLATSPTLITPALGTPTALVGTNISGTASGLSIGGNAGTVTDGVYTTDTSTVTNTMLAGSIANNKLVNSAITINGSSTSLGGSISVGTVTSVTGTSPISSSGGAAPDISISAAGVSTSGYLSATDWNTFNNKGSGTVTNLTGPITSVGNATSIASQTGTGSTFVVATSPVLVTPNLGTPSAGTLTNCTFPTLNQDTTGTAAKTNALNSATTVVNVSSATAPTVGQILTATSGTAATWQTPASGGVTTIGFGTTGLTPSGATSGVVTVAGTLAVANGGTGVTTSTGTGNNVLSTSPTLVTPLLGTPTSGVLTNCTFPTLNQDTTGTAAKTNALNSATTVVNVSSATAPTTGQILTATSGTAATWQTPAAPSAFPAGTAMIFKQTAAPTGWTKVLTNDNSALRVVTGTASAGGSVAFTTAFASQAVAGTNAASGATTLAETQIPAHSHTSAAVSSASNGSTGGSGLRFCSSGSTGNTGGGLSHTHSAAAFTGTAINLAVSYIDVIVATKD